MVCSFFFFSGKANGCILDGKLLRQPPPAFLFLNSESFLFLWKLNVTSRKVSILVRCLNCSYCLLEVKDALHSFLSC